MYSNQSIVNTINQESIFFVHHLPFKINISLFVTIFGCSYIGGIVDPSQFVGNFMQARAEWLLRQSAVPSQGQQQQHTLTYAINTSFPEGSNA
jgi:hypothetical protein